MKVTEEQELNDFIIRALRKEQVFRDCVIHITKVQAPEYSKNQIAISQGTNEGYYIELTESHGSYNLIATIRIHYYPSLLLSVQSLMYAFIKEGRQLL